MSQHPSPPAALDLTWGGKLPGHGDFVWSTPRTALRAQFEHWLHLGMLQGRSRYGERWNLCLDQGAVWNFLLPARYSTQALLVTGCIAPSRDRVGRRYPLVAVCSLPATLQSPELLNALPQLLAHVNLALSTGISRTWPRETLEHRLSAIVSAWQAEPREAPPPPSSGEILAVLGRNAFPPHTTSRLLCPWPDLARLVQKRHCPSLWWASAPPRTVAYEPGLDPALICSLFGHTTAFSPRRGRC